MTRSLQQLLLICATVCLSGTTLARFTINVSIASFSQLEPLAGVISLATVSRVFIEPAFSAAPLPLADGH